MSKQDIHQLYDKSYKHLLSYPSTFQKLIASFIHEDWASQIDVNSLETMNQSFILQDFEKIEADIVYTAKLNDCDVIFYVLLEMQSKPDFSMPIRLQGYMTEIWRYYLKTKTQKEVHRKSFKLPPIIPIVLYNGSTSGNVETMFRQKIDHEHLFGTHILDFEYILLDVNRYNEEELIKIGNIASAIFLLDKKADFIEQLEHIKSIALYFKDLSDKERQVLVHWIKSISPSEMNPALEKDIELLLLTNKKDEVDILTSNFAESIKEFKAAAKLEGKLEGKFEGKLEGKLEGRLEEKLATAVNLLPLLDDATIAQATGLELAVVQELRANQ
ncbi:MAG: Rpn family recombination-promoting nuclease/putative transposase [Turicibacter sp.]